MMNNTTFQSQSESEITRLTYGIVLTIILILGLVGHVLTLLVLLHRDHRRKIITPYLVNLSLNNLCMIVCGFPLSVNAISRQGIGLNATELLCKCYGYMEAVTETASVLSLMALSIVLHWAIKHQKDQPISGKRLSKTTLLLSLGAIWLLPVIICFPPFAGWSDFAEVQEQMTCHIEIQAGNVESVTYAVFMLLIAFVIPLVITCVFFYKTYRYLQLIPRNNNSDQSYSHRVREQTIARMIILAVAAFITSWIPHYVTTFISLAHGENSISTAGLLITDILTKSSVVYNPIIFTASNSGFRMTLCQTLSSSRRHPVILPYSIDQLQPQEGRHQLEIVPDPI